MCSHTAPHPRLIAARSRKRHCPTPWPWQPSHSISQLKRDACPVALQHAPLNACTGRHPHGPPKGWTVCWRCACMPSQLCCHAVSLWGGATPGLLWCGNSTHELLQAPRDQHPAVTSKRCVCKQAQTVTGPNIPMQCGEDSLMQLTEGRQVRGQNCYSNAAAPVASRSTQAITPHETPRGRQVHSIQWPGRMHCSSRCAPITCTAPKTFQMRVGAYSTRAMLSMHCTAPPPPPTSACF